MVVQESCYKIRRFTITRKKMIFEEGEPPRCSFSTIFSFLFSFFFFCLNGSTFISWCFLMGKQIRLQSTMAMVSHFTNKKKNNKEWEQKGILARLWLKAREMRRCWNFSQQPQHQTKQEQKNRRKLWTTLKWKMFTVSCYGRGAKQWKT